MFGGLLRRAEQAVLKQAANLGAISSSYHADSEMMKEEARLNALEERTRALIATLSAQLIAARKLADANKTYVAILQSATAGTMDLGPLLRATLAQDESVTQVSDSYLKESLARLGKILQVITALRGDFVVRKERVIDHDSHTRRVTQCEADVNAAGNPAAVGNAKDALRKAQVKLRDGLATVKRMTDVCRARLSAAEELLASTAADASLAYLATQAHMSTHAADAMRGVMPTYPGAALHAVLLADVTRRTAAGALPGPPVVINAGLLRSATAAAAAAAAAAILDVGAGGEDATAAAIAAAAGDALPLTIAPSSSSGTLSFAEAIRAPVGVGLPDVPGLGLSFAAFHAAGAAAGARTTHSPGPGTAARGLLRTGLPGPVAGADASVVLLSEAGPEVSTMDGVVEGTAEPRRQGHESHDDTLEGGEDSDNGEVDGSGRSTPLFA
jgi:hypothetical protein